MRRGSRATTAATVLMLAGLSGGVLHAQPATPTTPATPAPAPAPATNQPAATPGGTPTVEGLPGQTPAPQLAGPTRPMYTLGSEGQWQQSSAPALGSDEAVIAEARRLIATGQFDQAIVNLDAWLLSNDTSGKAVVPAALLARGDARSSIGDEFEALYDYEQIIKSFPASAEYPIAVQRELEIGVKYLQGTKRLWWFGLRWLSAEDVGEELLIRVQERLPGSRVAERAGIELADYYYRERELTLASTAYEMFLLNYPMSPYRIKAMQRRIYANIARFKGPRYDASSLSDARILINRFMTLYPAQAQEAGLDDALLTRIDENAGLQMLEVAAWYVGRGDEASARYTLQRLLRRHPQSAAARRALDMIKEKGWSVTPGDDGDEVIASPAAPTGTKDETKPVGETKQP
ncbi:MAG: outer membrane protein assembly factor BamD [Phycisphaerales bacterium]|nr:outer membrane protein assembly factor BamD [Phycisphaerales bacterium]